MNLHVQISWQAQHFVNLHVQISWQAQHFVHLHVQMSWQAQYNMRCGQIANARNAAFFNGTGGSEAGKSRSAERRVRDGLGSFSDHARNRPSIVFFHEYGRHVGGVPRSSLKGKETQHDDGEKNTSKPQKANKPNKPNNPNQTTPKGQRPIPHHPNSVSSVRR